MCVREGTGRVHVRRERTADALDGAHRGVCAEGTRDDRDLDVELRGRSQEESEGISPGRRAQGRSGGDYLDVEQFGGLAVEREREAPLEAKVLGRVGRGGHLGLDVLRRDVKRRELRGSSEGDRTKVRVSSEGAQRGSGRFSSRLHGDSLVADSHGESPRASHVLERQSWADLRREVAGRALAERGERWLRGGERWLKGGRALADGGERWLRGCGARGRSSEIV